MADLLGVPVINATLEARFSPVQVLSSKMLFEPELEKRLWSSL
jgi:hypothetical protein